MVDDPVEFGADMFRAAYELGYGVMEFTPRKIVLAPIRKGGLGTVTIESVFVSGDTLRRLLVPIATTNEPADVRKEY